MMGENILTFTFSFLSIAIHTNSMKVILGVIFHFILKEWKGVSQNTRFTIIAGVVTIILSVLVVSFGNYLKN